MRARRGCTCVNEDIILTMGYKGLLAIIRGAKPILEETELHLDAVNIKSMARRTSRFSCDIRSRSSSRFGSADVLDARAALLGRKGEC